jgi:hypothetical protein
VYDFFSIAVFAFCFACNLDATVSTSPEEAHLIESKSIYWVSRQADAREGISSFLEKRSPNYPLVNPLMIALTSATRL